MFGSILANVFLCSQLFFAANVPADKLTLTPTTAPVEEVAPSIAQVEERHPTFREMIRGEKLSLEDVKDPRFWIGTVRDLRGAIITFIPQLLVALVFLIVFWLIYRAVYRVVVGSLSKTNVDPSIRDMLGHLLKWSILGFGIIIGCNQVGIQITALLTGVSLIGLALVIGAYESLANFIAGVVIFWDKPFKIGDWITIEGTFGQVQRVTFRSTRVLDQYGCIFVFPNRQMITHKVCNHSAHPINAVEIPIGISYKAAIDEARAALVPLTESDERICTTPAPTVIVKELTDNAVVLALRFWLTDESKEKAIYAEYLEKAKIALDVAGVPFPQASNGAKAGAASPNPN